MLSCLWSSPKAILGGISLSGARLLDSKLPGRGRVQQLQAGEGKISRESQDHRLQNSGESGKRPMCEPGESLSGLQEISLF